MQNYKLTLAYDGTRYYGWQRLGSGDHTIQSKLEEVLSRFDGSPVEVHGSGRTDAGVHAKGQVASFKLKNDTDCETLLKHLRKFLPADIGALSLEKADERFHARLSAGSKTYCYTLWTHEEPCVFERKYAYVFRDALDLDAMRQAADILCGTHDFSAFCSNRHMKKSTVRTVNRIDFEATPHGMRISFTGEGFLYHMVRIMVGTLLEVGRGDRTAQSVAKLFGGKREDAGYTAPACGLCLMEVRY